MTRSLMHQKLNEHVQVSMHTIKHMYTKNIQDGVSLAFAHTKNMYSRKLKHVRWRGGWWQKFIIRHCSQNVNNQERMRKETPC